MSLVEEVAAAICYANCLAAHPGDIDRAVSQRDNGWDLWLDEARAAIPVILEAAAKACERRGNFGDYTRDELTKDFGQPRYDMMHAIIKDIRALGEGGGR